jgi:hypothetical protein
MPPYLVGEKEEQQGGALACTERKEITFPQSNGGIITDDAEFVREAPPCSPSPSPFSGFCLPPPLPASYSEPVTNCLAFLFDLRHPAESVWLFLQLILSGILSDIF